MAHDTRTLLDYLFDYGLDLRQRRVFLQSALDQGKEDDKGQATEHVIRSLMYLDKAPGPIELWLNTPGGNVDQMLALYDVIRNCTNKVTTVAFGEVHSAGVLILVAGDVRRATPNSWMMAHEISFDDSGPLHTVDASLAAIKRQSRVQNEIMGDRTNHPKDWWAKEIKAKREIWWDARQMKHHGVIDSIRPHPGS